MKNILFLSHKNKKTKLINFFKNKKYDIFFSNKPIKLINNLKKFDLIISFDQLNILEKNYTNNCKRPIINLSTSYLPYYGGSDQNIWSFINNTPTGVTIHEINKRFDKKNIIYQKLIPFDLNKDKSLKLKQINRMLILEVENLFIKKFDKIINQKYLMYKAVEIDSLKEIKKFPKYLMKNSNDRIIKIKSNYLNHLLKKEKNRLDLISKIENTRKTNNVNWMNLLKIAIKSDPDRTLEVLKKINSDDNKISKLIKKIH